MTRRPARPAAPRRMGMYPEPGLFKARLGKGRPWVPARVLWVQARDPETGEAMERPPVLVCLVAGEERDAQEMWTWLQPVDAEEYRRLLDAMPDDPRASVDLARADPVF